MERGRRLDRAGLSARRSEVKRDQDSITDTRESSVQIRATPQVAVRATQSTVVVAVTLREWFSCAQTLLGSGAWQGRAQCTSLQTSSSP